MMTILETLGLAVAWLMLHLIANILASVLVTNAAWWIVLIRGWLEMCVWEINVAMLFLILVSDAIMAVDWEEEALIIIELSYWIWDLLLFPFIHKLKENLSEKVSIIQEPGVSSEWVGENSRNRLWGLLLVSTKWPLIFLLWWLVKLDRKEGWGLLGDPKKESMSEWMIWFGRRARAHSCTLPPSFLKWSLIGISSAIVSIPSCGDVLNTSKIHMAALLCIFSKALSGYTSGA